MVRSSELQGEEYTKKRLGKTHDSWPLMNSTVELEAISAESVLIC